MRFFQCKHCGAVVSLATASKQPSICCNDTMVELVPNTTDGAREKHVPVIEINGNNVTVTVGETEHPMLDAHFIEWIFIRTKHGDQRKCLKPGAKPQVRFVLTDDDAVTAAYSYCNLHGLWVKKLS
ncbi:MAG: desulfoferrodoxin [Acidaminococcaceae bacterium]|nr:desulfoferrodoxin [Acidaminococcaceae bacterium]